MRRLGRYDPTGEAARGADKPTFATNVRMSGAWSDPNDRNWRKAAVERRQSRESPA